MKEQLILNYLQRLAKSLEITTDTVASMIVDFKADVKDEVKLDNLTVTAQRYYKKHEDKN